MRRRSGFGEEVSKEVFALRLSCVAAWLRCRTGQLRRNSYGPGGVTSTPGAPMSAGTEEVASQKRRGTSSAWLDFESLPKLMAWVGPDSKLSPSWRGVLFYCGRRGSSPQPHLLVEAPRGNRSG